MVWTAGVNTTIKHACIVMQTPTQHHALSRSAYIATRTRGSACAAVHRENVDATQAVCRCNGRTHVHVGTCTQCCWCWTSHAHRPHGLWGGSELTIHIRDAGDVPRVERLVERGGIIE